MADVPMLTRSLHHTGFFGSPPSTSLRPQRLSTKSVATPVHVSVAPIRSAISPPSDNIIFRNVGKTLRRLSGEEQRTQQMVQRLQRDFAERQTQMTQHIIDLCIASTEKSPESNQTQQIRQNLLIQTPAQSLTPENEQALLTSLLHAKDVTTPLKNIGAHPQTWAHRSPQFAEAYLASVAKLNDPQQREVYATLMFYIWPLLHTPSTPTNRALKKGLDAACQRLTGYSPDRSRPKPGTQPSTHA